MEQTASTILGMVVLLGILILVHEWGHFLAARAFGVRVDVFSIGFGPRIWGRKRGATDYRVSILPLGGYVKMAGDNPLEERTGEADEFLSKPRWQRAIIAVAGPTMNIVLAIVLFFGVFYIQGMPYPAYFDEPAKIIALGKGTPAEKAGLQAGDVVEEINGKPAATWGAVAEALKGSPAELQVAVRRGEREVVAVVPTMGSRHYDRLVGYPNIAAVIRETSSGGPAAKAGLKPDDKIVEVDGRPVTVWGEFVDAVVGSQGRPVALTVERGGTRQVIEVRPEQRVNPENPTAWQIGVVPDEPLLYQKLSLGESAQYGWLQTVGVTKMIGGVVGKLVQGKVSIKQLGGPIEIARQAGRAVRTGLGYFVFLMAVISVNLAVLNLLPIPILDGGHILMLGIEGILRRDLSMQFKERFVQAGLVFLLVIFVIVMYNDVLKLGNW